eukprot:scaffold314556_cov28-Tisochrysis_lutea.AAC.2
MGTAAPIPQKSSASSRELSVGTATERRLESRCVSCGTDAESERCLPPPVSLPSADTRDWDVWHVSPAQRPPTLLVLLPWPANQPSKAPASSCSIALPPREKRRFP